jgi:hypothetical protein
MLTQDTSRNLNYPMIIICRAKCFELHIRELALMARGPTLEDAYRQLAEQKAKVLQWATVVGLLDELPPPSPPALRFSSLCR